MISSASRVQLRGALGVSAVLRVQPPQNQGPAGEVPLAGRPVELAEDVEQLQRLGKTPAVAQERRQPVRQQREELRIFRPGFKRAQSTPHRLLRKVEPIRQPVGVRDLRENPAPQVGGRPPSQVGIAEALGGLPRLLGKAQHPPGIAVALGPAFLQEMLDLLDLNPIDLNRLDNLDVGGVLAFGHF